MQNIVKALRRKTPALLLKLDIAKAFDMHAGLALPAQHAAGKGLRPALVRMDLDDPFLGVLTSDHQWTRRRSNSPCQGSTSCPPVRASLYADDLALFINPVKEEIAALKSILSAFGDVTGLRVNFSKSSVIPIRCDGLDV